MFVGSDDQAKVYLNGKEVYAARASRSPASDQDTVTNLNFRVDSNVLVFKVTNLRGDWGGSVRFTGKDGELLQGIKVNTHAAVKDAHT